MRPIVAALVGLLSVAPVAHGQPAPPDSAAAESRWNDDGWPDLSGFLDEKYGFLPVLIPITEPAVGYGVGGGIAFIKKTPDGGRPNTTVVGGLATENGTWGALVGDSRTWMDGRVQTLAGVLYTSVNLDYYGIDESGALSDEPLSYNLAPAGGLLQARYRLGDSHVWTGLGYVFATVDVAFEAPAGTPRLPDYSNTSHLGGIAPLLAFDSRDNIFTPVRGTYAEASVGLFGEALGGDVTFQRAQLLAMQFIPLPARLFLGFRGQASASFGDTPFYLQPFVYMRGVPAMRYLGEDVAQLEAELRFQCYRRISLVGFVGAGSARNQQGAFEAVKDVVAGGPGVRYEIARKYGIHAGLDVGFGPDEPALYVTVGSAWSRP